MGDSVADLGGGSREAGEQVRLKSWHNRIFSALGMVMIAVICVVVAVLAVPMWLRVLAVVLGVAFLAWAVRAALIGVVCDDRGVTLRELSRTRRLTWSQIVGVSARVDPRMKLRAPAFVLELTEATTSRRAGRIPAMSLASRHPLEVDLYIATLEALWRKHVADSPR